MPGAKKTLSKIQRLACLGITGKICTTPTGALEALNDLPPLDLVIQGEARSAAHRLWSLGCWAYLHTNCGHSSILMQLQRSDPLFNTGVDIRKLAFNLERKYRVIMLTMEEWSRGPVTPVVKELVCFNDRSRTTEVTGAVVYRKSLERRLRISLENMLIFLAEVYAILACVYEIKMNVRPQKYVSICSDSQAALKAIQTATRLRWYDNAKRC
jgi:hypothetical protein